MEQYLQYLDVLKVVLATIGAVILGLPALLHALVIFFDLIPGDQPDKILKKLYDLSQKLADVADKILPKAPK